MNRIVLTFASLHILATQWQHITTMTAPISADIAVDLETMRNTVIELRLVWIALSIRLADALGDDLRVTLLVAQIFAVGTLHADRIL